MNQLITLSYPLRPFVRTMFLFNEISIIESMDTSEVVRFLGNAKSFDLIDLGYTNGQGRSTLDRISTFCSWLIQFSSVRELHNRKEERQFSSCSYCRHQHKDTSHDTLKWLSDREKVVGCCTN